MTATIASKVLKDVVAYVDVWSVSKTENYSDPFIQQLRDLGAQVNKTFNKQVTHVVFKHGHQSTWNKAKKMGVKIVSVHWVARCKENTEHADEDLYPAQNEESKLSHLKKRTHRCMQPKDVPLSTPKRLKRKLDKMMEALVRSSPIVAVTDSDTSPFIIDEERGIVYSPASKRADSMAQRLKEMRAQRENLSPTASQIQDSPSEYSEPSLGETPTDFSIQLLEEEEEASCSLSHTNCCPESEKGNKENPRQPPTKNTTNGHVEKSPHDIVNPSSVKKPVKVSRAPQNKIQRHSCSGITKQSSLDIYIHTKSSRKSEPQLLTTPENETDKTSRKSSCSNKKSKINSLPSNTEMEMSHIPLDTKSKAKHTESGTISSGDMKLAKYDCLAKNNFATLKKAQKELDKRKHAHVPGSDNHFTIHSDGDDSVFEDYFTSTTSAPNRKVVLTHSSSGALPLPVFDLEPLNIRKHKSHSQINNNRNRKHIVLNDKPIMKSKISDKALQVPDRDASSSQCVSQVDEKPTCKDVQQEPATKRQRRRTNQIVFSFSERTDSKSTSDELSDRSSELCRMNTNQWTAQMDKYMKKNRTLVMTSMPTEKQQTVHQVVNCLGGFTVVDMVCESTTHVVSGTPRRTLNVLLGIARGCWILSFDWILWCLEHRQWIPEEPYELSDHFPAAPICRLQQHLSAGEHQQDLFRDQPLMYVSSLSRPPCHNLIELIQLCGGAVCRSVRQAGICIGEYKGKKPEGAKCLSEQWILDCMTHHVLLPYDNYILH